MATGASASAVFQAMDRYWAACPPAELAQYVMSKIEAYRNDLKRSQLWMRYVRAWRSWHGLADPNVGDASQITRRGSKGHRASVRTSTAAIDGRHQLALIAPNIPALDAVPINTAYRTVSQVPEAKRFFDYYVARQGLGRRFYQTAAHALQFGISWIVTDWDVFGGPRLPQAQPIQGQLNQTPNQQTHQGELKFRAHTPLDLVLDIQQDGHHGWFISRDKVNKWKLVADYPSLKDNILNIKSIPKDDEWFGANFRIDSLASDQITTDLIPVWTLHHRDDDSIPGGRMFRCLDADTWLFDGPYPYSNLTLAEMSVGRIWNSAMGDSTFHHGLGIQTAMDRALGGLVTNVLALGHQLVSIPDENFDFQELSDGISAIVGGAMPNSEPRGISLLTPQSENYRLIEFLEKYVHAASAINSVIRGEPDSNIKSGAYGGLIVQQATQYNGPFQFSFSNCVEDTGNHMLDILKRFAVVPILGEISGPKGQWRLKEFKREDLAGIHRLVAKQGQDQSTPIFRKQKADMLLEAGLIQSPQEYNAMIDNDSPELGTEDQDAAELMVLLENETMQALADNQPLDDSMAVVEAPGQRDPMGNLPTDPMTGMPTQPLMVPPVLMTDNDVLHVKKHSDLLNSPGSRGNQALIKIIGAHCQWHMQNSLSKPPELAMMLGQPVPNAPPPPGQEGAPPNGAKSKEQKPKGPNGVQAVRPVTPPPENQSPAGMGP